MSADKKTILDKTLLLPVKGEMMLRIICSALLIASTRQGTEEQIKQVEEMAMTLTGAPSMDLLEGAMQSTLRYLMEAQTEDQVLNLPEEFIEALTKICRKSKDQEEGDGAVLFLNIAPQDVPGVLRKLYEKFESGDIPIPRRSTHIEAGSIDLSGKDSDDPDDTDDDAYNHLDTGKGIPLFAPTSSTKH